MDIVIKDNQRYKQYKDRLRRLCNLEKCNYPCLSNGLCKKHNIKDNEQICETCLKVEDKEDFIENNSNCKKCREKIERKSPEYKSITVIRNGVRYKTFPNSGTRKLCKIETCPNVASGEFCRKHKPQCIEEHEKQCHRCLTVKDLSEFKNENIEYANCTNCREYKQKQSVIRHQDRRKFILQLKIDMGGKCVDCGTEDLEVLEFDHVIDNKVAEVRRVNNYEGMLNESKKCLLRCCNCHMIKTKQTVKVDKIDEDNTRQGTEFVRIYRERARNYVKNVKMNSSGCIECGWFDEDNLQVLHFDHINEDDKEHNIARLVSTGRSLEVIQYEINKCRLLCSNCHRKRTLRQFDYPVLELIKNLQGS